MRLLRRKAWIVRRPTPVEETVFERLFVSGPLTMSMRVIETELSGVLIIEPRCFGDERGFFLESFQSLRYCKAGIHDKFVQDNHSRSMKGVLRGLHFTIKRPQAQIVTVMRGKIFDVVVDLRRSSATFGRWFGAELSDEGDRRQIYMAPGFAHGFCVLSDVADLHYKVSGIYDRADEGGLLWNDPEVGIHWPIDLPLVSPRDAAYPRLVELQVTGLPQVNG
jgi:dTDP-4-dehydrorhamnose 3,5-epimerase